MIASWACEVTEILTQRSTEEASFVSRLDIRVDIAVSVVYDTF